MAEIHRNLWDRAANTWRRLVDTATVAWTTDTPGVASASVVAGSITNAMLADMAAWTFKVRNAATAGAPSDAALADITTEAAPAAGDFALGFLASGEIRKFDVGNFGGGVALQVFTASGTYTPTPGMAFALVASNGGGGGGGGADVSVVNVDVGVGSGGGAGGTCIELFSAAAVGASQTVTIGAAGAAGSAANGTSGGNGGNTMFGGLHTATGGVGGVGSGVSVDAIDSNLGSAGGVPTGGALNITGGDGGSAIGEVVTAGIAFGGHGGGSIFGSGGRGGATSTIPGSSAGAAGAAFGSGGGGGVSAGATAGAAGGAGAAGVVIVLEFV